MARQVGEIRSQTAYLSGEVPIVLEVVGEHRDNVELRLEAFFPDTYNPLTGQQERVFVMRVNVTLKEKL